MFFNFIFCLQSGSWGELRAKGGLTRFLPDRETGEFLGGYDFSFWGGPTLEAQSVTVAEDPRFDAPGRRLKNRDALTAEVNAALADSTAQQWMDRFNEAGIPSGPILNMEEMFIHPQIAAREMLLKMAHPVLGEFKTTGLGVKLADTPGSVTRPPLVGEHTDEVLRAHGYTADEIAHLRDLKAIG